MCGKMSSRTTKRKMIKQVAVSLLIFILFDAALIFIEYGNYKEKINLLSTVVSQEDTVKIVTGILKGESLDYSEGEAILKEYGFERNRDNVIYRRFWMQCGKIIGLSILLFGAEMILFLIITRKRESREITEIKQLEKIVSDYRKENFNDQIVSFRIFSNTELGRLYLEIEALGNTLQLLHKRMRAEKEETKSLVTDISKQLKTRVAALKTSF